MDGTGISYYLRGLVDLVVSPALHIFKCRYHILFDAPRQENTCLCRHSCLKMSQVYLKSQPAHIHGEKKTKDRLSVRSACCSSSLGYWQSFW